MSKEKINAVKEMYQRYQQFEPAPATACAILAVGAALVCVGLDIRDAIEKCAPMEWRGGAR